MQKYPSWKCPSYLQKCPSGAVPTSGELKLEPMLLTPLLYDVCGNAHAVFQVGTVAVHRDLCEAFQVSRLASLISNRVPALS